MAMSCWIAFLTARQAACDVASQVVLYGKSVPLDLQSQEAAQWLTDQGVLEGGNVADAFVTLKTSLINPTNCESGD